MINICKNLQHARDMPHRSMRAIRVNICTQSITMEETI